MPISIDPKGKYVLDRVPLLFEALFDVSSVQSNQDIIDRLYLPDLSRIWEKLQLEQSTPSVVGSLSRPRL